MATQRRSREYAHHRSSGGRARPARTVNQHGGRGWPSIRGHAGLFPIAVSRSAASVLQGPAVTINKSLPVLCTAAARKGWVGGGGGGEGSLVIDLAALVFSSKRASLCVAAHSRSNSLGGWQQIGRHGDPPVARPALAAPHRGGGPPDHSWVTREEINCAFHAAKLGAIINNCAKGGGEGGGGGRKEGIDDGGWKGEEGRGGGGVDQER